jgi:hypothetical protein
MSVGLQMLDRLRPRDGVCDNALGRAVGQAESVIGLLMAHALDITIPESILLRVDKVIR